MYPFSLSLGQRLNPGGVLGYKRDGGGGGGGGGGRGGGVRRIFLGLKFSTPVFFWFEELTVYFLGLKNLRVLFWVRIFARLINNYSTSARWI